MTHRITRLVGNRRIAPIVDDIDFADDDGEDAPDYRATFRRTVRRQDAADRTED